MTDRRIEELANKFGLSNGQAKRRFMHRKANRVSSADVRGVSVAGTGKRGKNTRKGKKG